MSHFYGTDLPLESEKLTLGGRGDRFFAISTIHLDANFVFVFQ